MQVCKICGQSTKSYPHPKFKMVFHECEHCELIFKDASLYVSAELEKEQYDYHENDEENQGYVNYLTNFLEASLYPFFKQGKVLDFGSGPNPVLQKILNKDGFQTEIYDMYYADEPSVLNNRYDAITSTEVIEHLKDPVSYFMQFNQMLHMGGYLALMTLFHQKDQIHFFNWFYIRDITHVCFYTPKTISILAKLSGFEVMYTNGHRYITLKKIQEIKEGEIHA